jgi:hypothetical protein
MKDLELFMSMVNEERDETLKIFRDIYGVFLDSIDLYYKKKCEKHFDDIPTGTLLDTKNGVRIFKTKRMVESTTISTVEFRSLNLDHSFNGCLPDIKKFNLIDYIFRDWRIKEWNNFVGVIKDFLYGYSCIENKVLLDNYRIGRSRNYILLDFFPINKPKFDEFKKLYSEIFDYVSDYQKTEPAVTNQSMNVAINNKPFKEVLFILNDEQLQNYYNTMCVKFKEKIELLRNFKIEDDK